MAASLMLALPGNLAHRELHLTDASDPHTWTATTISGRQRSLSWSDEAASFLQDMKNSHKVELDMIYVSISQDDDGRHRFINFEDVAQALQQQAGSCQLPLVPEAEAKAKRDDNGAVLLYATGPPVAAPTFADAAASVGKAIAQRLGTIDGRHSALAPQMVKATAQADDMCPHRSIWASNYTVIPDLSIGNTQRLILCDEATLTRQLPDERIFDYLQLIVNCHERSFMQGKYRVGSCSTGPHPRVICQAVHEWHSLGSEGMNRVNDEIQAGIWDALEKGTVAVHCLAGIHRAACIVACHFLWRHYILGHQDIPADAAEIYRRLIAVRPHVSPAYAHVLRNYEAHLKKQAARQSQPPAPAA
jgi:hypothetical protein